MAHAGSCLAARLQPRNDAELKRHALGAALVGSSPTTPRCECNSGQLVHTRGSAWPAPPSEPRTSVSGPAMQPLSRKERGARRVPLRDTKRNRAMTPTQAPCLASRFWEIVTHHAAVQPQLWTARSHSRLSLAGAPSEPRTSVSGPATQPLSRKERGGPRVPLRRHEEHSASRNVAHAGYHSATRRGTAQ